MDSEQKGGPVMVSLRDLMMAALMIVLPYLIIGVFWASAHGDHLQNVYGVDNLFSYLGEIIAWPVLIFSDITLQ